MMLNKLRGKLFFICTTFSTETIYFTSRLNQFLPSDILSAEDEAPHIKQ